MSLLICRSTFAAIACWMLLTSVAAAQTSTLPIALVEDGKSAYVIYHDADAPETVALAAGEIQRALRISTGVTLPVVHAPAKPMICLGDGVGADAAGLAGDALAYENFHIVTRHPNIYIVGRDTANNQQTRLGGTSRGTLYGAYHFLEQQLGVRWLMPGDIGEVIPRRTSVTIAPLNLSDGPDFEFRRLENPSGMQPISEWYMRQRLTIEGTEFPTGSLATARFVPIFHSWPKLMPRALLEKHPEWAAQNLYDGAYLKFCTRNSEAIQAFADNVIAWIDERPEVKILSIGPSDGQMFCHCPRCAPAIERDPQGQFSYSAIILEFYNNIARIIARERPGYSVGGFMYGGAGYPPAVDMPIEPNVFLYWAPLEQYGLGLYLPIVRDEFETVATRWRTYTDNLFYLNYLHWHRSDSNAPLAPALSLLKREMPTLKALGYKGIYTAGIAGWSHGGSINYLMGRQLWDADLDVDAQYREWMTLAYGDGAPPMMEINRLIDEGFQEHKSNAGQLGKARDSYEVTPDKIVNIYLPRLKAIESLYQQAMAGAQDKQQQRRLRLYGANMVVFHYNLRKAGYLPHPESSFFFRDDEAYSRFLAQPDADLPNFPWLYTTRSKPLALPPQATTPLERRTLNIPRLAGDAAPAIDGQTDDAAWSHAAVAEDFRIPGKHDLSPLQSSARLIYDDKHLYLTFTCVEPTSSPPASALILDDPRAWNESCVEIHIAVGDNPYNMWHFMVTPANNRWDGIRDNMGPDPQWVSATSIGDGQWAVEMAISLVDIGLSAPQGRTIRANLTRSCPSADPVQHATWNALNGSFLEPTDLGQWFFQK